MQQWQHSQFSTIQAMKRAESRHRDAGTQPELAKHLWKLQSPHKRAADRAPAPEEDGGAGGGVMEYVGAEGDGVEDVMGYSSIPQSQSSKREAVLKLGLHSAPLVAGSAYAAKSVCNETFFPRTV